MLLLASLGCNKPPVNPADSYTDAASEVREVFFDRDYEGAVMLAERLLESRRNDTALQAWHTVALSLNTERDDALGIAEAMMDQHPDDPWSWFALAGTTTWHGDHDERALDVSSEMLKRSFDHPDFIWMRAFALRQHDPDSALVFIDAYEDLFETDPELFALKGAALISTSREGRNRNQEVFDAGLKVYEQVREQHPDALAGFYLAASTLMNVRRLDEARELLEEALLQSPNSLPVHYLYWRNILGSSELTEEEKLDILVTDIMQMQQVRPHAKQFLLSAANVFDRLNEEEKRDNFEQRILEIAPFSKEAEWVYVGRYRRYQKEIGREGFNDPVKRHAYAELVRQFLDRPLFKNEALVGDAYRGLFYALRADSMEANPDDLLASIEGMVEYEDLNPHIVYAQGAIALADRGVHFQRAAEIASLGIEEGRKKIDEQNEQDIYKTEADYDEGLRWMESMMVEALGWVYFKEGRFDDAERELLRSLDLSKDRWEIYHRLGQIYESRYEDHTAFLSSDQAPIPENRFADLELAESYYLRGSTKQTMGINQNTSALQRIYQKKTGSMEGFDAFLLAIEERDQVQRKEKVLAEQLEDARLMPAISLKDLGGNTWSSADATGKKLIINYWGTWCGPCVAEMPDFQNLHEKYKSDDDVIVLTINNDTNPDDVRQYMAENEFDFVVLLDNGYVGENNIYAFPTTWFVNSDHRIEFEKTGWSEKLEEEFRWRIEVLQ